MNTNDTTQKPKLNSGLTGLICNDMSLNLIDAGEFITKEDAITSLRNYFNDTGVMAPDDNRHVYGHTFGLNSVKELVARIDQYNSLITHDEDLIKGVRVYHGKSLRNDPDFPLQNGVMYRDVFFMPVKTDGSDLYDIQFLGNEIILGNGRPCPNECGFSFFQL